MHIHHHWRCRECDSPNVVTTDTADYPLVYEAMEHSLERGNVVAWTLTAHRLIPLTCARCGHVSEEVILGRRER